MVWNRGFAITEPEIVLDVIEFVQVFSRHVG